MNSLKQKKKITFLLISGIFSALCLTGCGNNGKLNEGDCKCNIMFADIPKEFQMLEESLLERFEIEITLQNPITETEYEIILNQDNDYSEQISLKPGTYQVKEVSGSMPEYNGISLISNVPSIELTPNVTNELPIVLENPEEFSQHWIATQPMPELLLADKFSRKIQINREMIDIANITSKLNLTYESDKKIKPYEKISLTDSDYGITVELMNNNDEAAPWTSCEVIGITVYKNTVVFPEGVTLGMSADKVLHKTDGIYGEPDSFSGTMLFGWGHDSVEAIYSDETSGDRITFTLIPDCSYITEIHYEFAVFE